MIGIINYGLGNLLAFKNSFEILGKPSKILNHPLEVEKCSHLILPGVGSFDFAIERLQNSKIFRSVEKAVFEEKKPILGVCSGMQIMFEKSEEGIKNGLGWIDGEVVKFSDDILERNNLPIPHIGWNKIQPRGLNKVFAVDIEDEFYFLHSFYCLTNQTNILATSFYGLEFASIVRKDNIYGTQFHPEKSQNVGLELLSNFADI